MKSVDDQSSGLLQRIWGFLSSLGVETNATIITELQDSTSEMNRKRKNEEGCYPDGGGKRFHHSEDADGSNIETQSKDNHEMDHEELADADGELEITREDSDPIDEPSNESSAANNSEAILSTGREKHAEDQVEESRSDGDMPSLDDQAVTPSTSASSICVTMSSPSPPDLKRENGGLSKDEVTVVSSVRSDYSEVDVGGPTYSPAKGQSSLPSSVKNVTSHCSTEDEHQTNSSKNAHDDDDCKVVAIETVHNDASSCVELTAGFHHVARHYHHHDNASTRHSDVEKRMYPPVDHERLQFCTDIPQYIDPPKQQQHPTTSFFTLPNRQDASYSRQCQSVAPGNCSNSNKSGKSKKSSKLPDDEVGFCGMLGERINEKISSGMNSMQERCNSVFVDPGHYPPLPFNQSPGNNQLFQRPIDYIDGRIDRPATRCGFESSFPQHFNAEFPHRFVAPHPANPVETNIGYQMQERNLQSSCMPGAKLNQPGGYGGGNRGQQSTMSKTSKRTNKAQGVVPPVCYSSSKSSNILTNSPTIGGPITPDPLLNAIYRFPNMTQGFEIPSPGYGLPNRFAPESNKSNFIPPNSYFSQQSSPPGACQIQSQHNTNQPHSQHVNRGNNGNASDSVLHHRPSDEASHQQALFLQHQRQQQAAYLNPAAYFAKLHQFHSELGQFQYPAPFHSSSSPTPIDMSLHVPTRPSAVDGKSSLLGMQQHRDSFSEVDFFQSYKMFNLGSYPGSVDPRNIVHRNPQNQVGMFGHQQQPQLESNIQSPYSAYLNGGNRAGNDLFSNSNLSDLMRK